MCEKDSCEKRSEIVGDKERASKGGRTRIWRWVWSMHMRYLDGNVCLKLITVHNDCTPVKCFLKFMVNLGLADFVLERENSFLENAEYTL